jgi:ABC-type multidrug transport system fused ATPase/permease subunit
MSYVKSSLEIARRSFILARPYGLKRLAGVFAFSLAQGVFQVVGIGSIFPFLALAADPSGLRNSKSAEWFLVNLPPMSDKQLLMSSGFIALVMLLLSNIICMAAEINRAQYARGFCDWLRVRLLYKIASRSYGDFLQTNSGVLLKKVTGDVVSYTTGVLLPLLDSFARIISIVLLLGTLLLVNPEVAIGAALLFSVLYLTVFGFLGKRRKQATDGVKIANRGIMREAQQLLGGIKAIKVHRAEELFLNRFRAYSGLQAKLTAWMPLYQNGPRYLVEPFAFGGLVIVVLIYAVKGEDFVSILPTLGVMALAGYRLLPALQLIYGQLTVLSTTRHALDEVYEEFLDVERSVGKEDLEKGGRFSVPPPMQWGHEIRLENLTFQYPSACSPIINRLNLTITKNSSLGIIGTTGSGKSTLVDLILGLHAPTSGKILVDGTPLSAGNRRAWRGGIGYVPQDIFLIDDTIVANIAIGVPEEKVDFERIKVATAAAQILDFISGLPSQWETKVGERGVRLSGGQRQRLGLARALYHQPSLLILDEATSALDNATEWEIMKSINALRGSTTLIIIAHRLTTIEDCERKLDLDHLS